MSRRWGLIAVMPAAVAGIAVATVGVHAGAAGKPQKQDALLCGLWMQGDATDNVSGKSNQDHVDGADVSGGQYYDYNTPSGQNTSCKDEYNNGNFKSGAQTFTWKINHSNVNVSTEHGTEHGQFVLQNSSAWEAGFQGQISEYDFTTPVAGTTSDPSADGSETIYYESGHPGGAGNFNTHGGAASGQHYRGTYGTRVYQDGTTGSPCQPRSPNYCFQAILTGQVN